MPTNKHLPQNWDKKLYVLLSLPGWTTGEFYHEAIRFFTAWAQAEGGDAQYNPLNTTNHIQDSWGPFYGPDYNRITVCNYNDPWQGIVATAATLLNSSTFMPGIVAPLRKMQGGNVTAENFVKQNKVAIETWGTNAQLILDCLKTIK